MCSPSFRKNQEEARARARGPMHWTSLNAPPSRHPNILHSALARQAAERRGRIRKKTTNA